MVPPSKNRRPRRQFDDEFKAGAVRLVLDEGQTVGRVSRDLDLTESALRNWVDHARADRTKGRTGLTTEEREELQRLRKEVRTLRTEREILKKAGGLLCQGECVRFAFIQAEKAEFSVRGMCRTLEVSPSGFYAWRRRPPSAHARRDQQLRVLIRASHEASRCRYGSPRVHEDLIEQGEPVSRKRVVRLMQAEGLQARVRKRFTCTTMSDHDQPVAANLLAQEFMASAPNQRWVGDTTEFVIGSSGKLYLAAILDLYSRFLVGWAVSAINDRHLVIQALQRALKRRAPGAGLLHHSDQGSPYASEDYQRIIKTHRMTGSMSRRGNCYDNAVMESWFSTVKHELGEHFESCGDAKMALFDYIEVFYNQQRRHSTLGQISPAEFERRMRASAA
ncbi:MAG: IS3 family transposase [Gammaproteobacteria bacterium]